MQNQSSICSGQIGVIGLSRGGELALQLGATYLKISAVIAASPSAYRYAGVRNNMPLPLPAWTLNNEALPYLKPKFDASGTFQFFWNWITRRPNGNKAGFIKTLKDSAKTAAVRIPVERIQEPIMLVSGGDDQLLPSFRFAEIVMKRLTCHHHPYNIHLHYKDAGHFPCFPYTLPYMPPNVMLSPGGGMTITFGGNDKANTRAALDSWPKMLDFLK
nr:acyl-CoA thioester hydrolase/BAAT C-terminal domain-containing protein [Paenibacillus sp. MSJ-34]